MRILRPICLVGLTFFALLTRAAEDNQQRVRFREVDTLFANPGQGWMSQQRNPNCETRFPCSVAYIRFDWTDVEPQESQYNWKFLDDAISAWKPRGAAVAMRVMTANAHSGGYYSSTAVPDSKSLNIGNLRAPENHSLHRDLLQDVGRQ
jgi:hypothetical protein